VILGLLADTHGDAAITAGAVSCLREAGAEAFIHCGDIGTPEVLDELAGLRLWIVWGNSDWPAEALVTRAAELGFEFPTEVPMRVQLDDRIIAVFHGHETQFTQLIDYTPLGEALRAEYGECDYIIHGHTHIASDVRLGPLRLINPGALGATRRPTAATLDLATDRVRFIRVSRETL